MVVGVGGFVEKNGFLRRFVEEVVVGLVANAIFGRWVCLG